MPFVYRYIDLDKEEVVYIGKVTKGDLFNDFIPLQNRHEQHKREEWYKNASDSMVMQYIETETHADADILETWLISYYDTGQLVNKAKTGWGKPMFDLSSVVFGKWRTYGRGTLHEDDEAIKIAGELIAKVNRMTEGYFFHLDTAIAVLNDNIREIAKDKQKAYRLSRFDEQEDFKRHEKLDEHSAAG